MKSSFTFLFLLTTIVLAAQDNSRRLANPVKGLNVESASQGTIIRFRCSRSLPDNAEPMLILDGKTEPLSKLSSINPNHISSVSVIKSAEATGLFGPDGVNGALIVRTKNSVLPGIMIRDTEDNKPVPFATVVFYHKTKNVYNYFVADSNGYVEYDASRRLAGWELKVSATGYKPYSRQWIAGDKLVHHEIALERDILTNQEVVVSVINCYRTIRCETTRCTIIQPQPETPVTVNLTNSKIDAESGTSSALLIYPNPASRGSKISCELPGSVTGPVVVNLHASSGLIVYSQRMDGSDKAGPINLQVPANISAGVYFIRLTCANGRASASGKLIIQ